MIPAAVAAMTSLGVYTFLSQTTFPAGHALGTNGVARAIERDAIVRRVALNMIEDPGV